LRILKELILSGEAPSVFHAKLLRRDADLLRKLGSSPDKPLALFDDSVAKDEEQRERENSENRKHGVLVSELHFLCQMRKDNSAADSWENIFIPSQTLDALQQRHTDDGKLDAAAAIRELLGTINDPIVRHRLGVFAARLKKLQHGDEKEEIPKSGVPDFIVLEFAREDFMGEDAVKKYQRFLNERADERKKAREEAEKLGLESRSSGLRYELFKAQGGICLYTGKSLAETSLDDYEIDHIVPRSLGGPDAAVNYVLTFHDVNHTKEKGKLTPFALLHGNQAQAKEGWNAYVKRVEDRATTLRNKKVQLLTRQDAPELVERYTALAETAWISKLAQAIVNLHFGWTNGYDENRTKRVIVVSGGVTARVRRKYGLDKLLYNDTTDAEVLAKKVKNREDKRHHALDAMVMTFIPQWARDPNKEGFFRFPPEFRDKKGREDYERIRELFSKRLSDVMPRNIAFERAALADTSFGGRLDGGKPIIVKRVTVFDLAQEPAGAPGKTKFSLKYLIKKTESVRDETIKRRLKEEFVEKEPDEVKWKKFCDSFAQKRKGGITGARIIKVWVYAGEPDEFKDLSKDGTGAWRKAKDDHQGQIIYTNIDGNLAVKPVYAHASIRKETQKISESGGKSKVHCFVRSKCLFRLRKELEQPNYKSVVKSDEKKKQRLPANAPLKAAMFMLNTIITKSMDVEFTASNGKRLVAPLRVLIDAGFEPV
jgi:CRISPR-associated endonuclease Csn1